MRKNVETKRIFLKENVNVETQYRIQPISLYLGEFHTIGPREDRDGRRRSEVWVVRTPIKTGMTGVFRKWGKSGVTKRRTKRPHFITGGVFLIHFCSATGFDPISSFQDSNNSGSFSPRFHTHTPRRFNWPFVTGGSERWLGVLPSISADTCPATVSWPLQRWMILTLCRGDQDDYTSMEEFRSRRHCDEKGDKDHSRETVFMRRENEESVGGITSQLVWCKKKQKRVIYIVIS